MEEEKKEEVVQQPVSTPEVEKPKKNVLLFVIISLIMLIGIGVLLFVLLNKSDDDKPKENEQKEETEEKEEEKEETEEKKYTLDVYGDSDGYVCIYGQSENCNKVLYSIAAETPDAKLLDFSGYNKYLLYKDNGLYIYDTTNKTSKKTQLEDTHKNYKMLLDEKDANVIAISYTTNDNYLEYYNLLLNKKLYQNKFKTDGYDFYYQANDKYIVATHNEKTYLLNASKEETVLTDKSEFDASSYRSEGENGEYVYLLERCTGTCGIEKIYSNDFKLIFENKVDEDGEYDVYNKYVYVYEASDKTIKKFDFYGKLISTSKPYNDIEQIEAGYVVYINNNKYVIENIDNPTESKEIVTVDKEKAYYDMESGYYDRKQLDRLGEKDKKEGFYIVIVYYEQDKNTGYYGMEYCYTPSKEIVTFPILQEVGGRAKPVLYLYPTKDTNVKVEFAHPEYLTTTYPKYNKSWNVLAKPNGDLYDKNGKYYYALYWDETRYNEVDFSEGFYVESKDAIKFLEEKLSIIGLNDKERNEFIMYWLPILENNKKSVVYFELTKEREAGNKLNITPKPDSMLRVSIHIKKVDNKVNIKEQKLETFKRTGFTVVEWGGMTY